MHLTSLALGEPKYHTISKPRLLFFAYYFPPAPAIGSVRAWNIAKYLARMNWQVTVVTPHPQVWRTKENQNNIDAKLVGEGIQRIAMEHRWRCLSPTFLNGGEGLVPRLLGGACRKVARLAKIEREIGWMNEAEKACSLLRPDDVDVVLATGAPFSSFKLAQRLSKRLGCPYVLDYRDPWSNIPSDRTATPSKTARDEAELLSGSSAVTVVSDSLLDAGFQLGEKLHVVTNGFDAEEMASIRPHDFGHFALVYAGTFYPPRRVITPVMEALKRLKENPASISCHWAFHYYGPHGDHVREQAERCGVAEHVVLHGVTSRAEALSAIRGAGLAIVITSVADRAAQDEKGIVTGKIFEPVGLSTPFLLIAPRESFVETVVETTGLAGVFTGGDIDGIACFVAAALSGRLPQPKRPATFAWQNVIKKMDAILRRAVDRSGPKSCVASPA